MPAPAPLPDADRGQERGHADILAAPPVRRRTGWLRRALAVIGRVLTPVRRLIGGISTIGIAGYPPDTQRRLKIVNVFSALIATTTFIYAVNLATTGDERMLPAVYMNLGLAFAVAMVPLAHRFGDTAGASLLVVAEFAALTGFTAFFTRSGGAPMQYIVAAAAAFVIFDSKRTWLVVTIVALALALHLFTWFTFQEPYPGLAIDQKILDSLYTQGAITTFGLIAASVYYAFSLAERAKAETENVLRNVLPDSVVERLMSRPNETIADSFPQASVLFADITGFVALARSLGPEKTVDLLNRLVSAFDALAQKHGVEKIKTIGDAYMVASGIPLPRPDHAAALARMGLEMLLVAKTVSRDSGFPINIRVGMASGPMMAGVIGTKKFSYDVWGDPVNLASRLEALSTPGRILVCPTCRAALEPEFDLESRGIVDIKGVGAQETWFVNGERAATAEPSPSSAASRQA